MPEAVLDMIEPDAKAMAADAPDNDLLVALASIAISLRRLAETTSGAQLGDLATELHGPLTNLAWEAGRSFGAGTRIDR